MVERDHKSSDRNVIKDLELEEVAHSSGLGDAILLVGRVVYRIVEVMRDRWVAQAVRLTVRLRRRNICTVVDRCGVHRRLVGRSSFRDLGSRNCARRSVTRRSTASKGSETALTFLNLGLNAATVWGLADLRKDGTHGFDQVQTQFRWSEFQSSLNNVITIGVTHKPLELFNVEQLLNHGSLCRHLSTADALLDDIRAELLHRKLGNLALETKAKRGREVGVVQIKNVLDNVVTKRILHKMEAVGGDLADEINLLEPRSVVDATLEDTTAVTVSSDNDTVLAYGVEDELRF